MIVTVSGRSRPHQSELFERLFKLRYEVFVGHRRWSIPTRKSLDIDQYDCPSATYFFELDDAGEIHSHVRLTPTAHHSLLADYFPHLVNAQYSARGETIMEATRFIIVPRDRSPKSKRSKEAELFAAVLQWCKAKGVTDLQAVLDTTLYPTFMEMAPQTFPLGLPQPYGGGNGTIGGGEALAVRCPVNSRGIEDVRAYGGLDHVPCAACIQGFDPMAA